MIGHEGMVLLLEDGPGVGESDFVIPHVPLFPVEIAEAAPDRVPEMVVRALRPVERMAADRSERGARLLMLVNEVSHPRLIDGDEDREQSRDQKAATQPQLELRPITIEPRL